MAGGRLRDGAYEGFPLGSGAVILNRLGSFLAVGPEPNHGDATGTRKEGYDLYYKGWLIGPSDYAPRIVWDSGDQNGDYIEVRQGKLAISANVTVKKTVGLIYDVWFVNGPTVTIDASGDSTKINDLTGLFANNTEENKYKFYGTSASTGGQNTGAATSMIVIKPGSTLDGRFLSAEDNASPITAEDTEIIIKNKGSSDKAIGALYEVNVYGYLNWDIPTSKPEIDTTEEGESDSD
jgi:hypothetical protein